jgi:8-oxo-dGTP diphosphatase
VEFTDYDTRLAAYAVIVDEQDRILLALWNEGSEPQWTMPGGGVEFEETVEEGVIRELREETGYDVELVGLLGVDSWVMPGERRVDGSGRPMKSVRVLFEARVVGGKLTHEVDGTTDEARWIPLADVAGLHRVDLIDTAIDLWSARRRQPA